MLRLPHSILLLSGALLSGLLMVACRHESAPEDQETASPLQPVPIGLGEAPASKQTGQSGQQTQSREADAASHGGTITFQDIGAAGWYPSRRDPASGACDAYKTGECCMAKHQGSGAGLSPWDEELILTLRGPMLLKQIAVYQPNAGDKSRWDRVSQWSDKAPAAGLGIAFEGNGESGASFSGGIGNKCLVDVSSDRNFPCGPGSLPYCPASSPSHRYGWQGSKLILLQASMPRYPGAALAGVKHCSTDPADNWFDAPWIGLSHGELIRSGKFGGCNCYGKDPAKWWIADGCGQFNVFETVNDNNTYQNFDLFSTNFFAYHGYVGEGPCGKNCNLAGLDPAVDLIAKATSKEAAPALASPSKGPGTAFRRPTDGFRYFLILMDTETRTVQLAVVHPGNVPASMAALVSLPSQVPRSAVDGMLALRLPGQASTGIYRR